MKRKKGTDFVDVSVFIIGMEIKIGRKREADDVRLTKTPVTPVRRLSVKFFLLHTRTCNRIVIEQLTEREGK